MTTPNTGKPSGGHAAGPAAPLIDLPEDWDHHGPVGPLALMARRRGHRGPMVPTVVVAYSREPASSSLDRYVEAQLAGVAGSVGGHLLYLHATHRPTPRLDLALAIDQLGFDLTVVQRHLLRPDGSSVTATGVGCDVDWSDVGPELLGAVRSLRIPRSGSDATP